MTDENYEARAHAHLASLKRDMRVSLEDAVVRAVYKVMAEFEAKSDERLMEDWGPGPHERHSQQAREPEHPAKPLTTEQMQGWVKKTWEKCLTEAHQEPEFFTHCVDQPYDWSEWVCPDPKSYLFKCCDCGLVHEAEFGVVRYKSETEREDCDMVDDPNLQAVFRMRRSEQWSPADMAHRAGGLTMEQPAQQFNVTSDHRLMENAQGELERIKLVQTNVGIGKPAQQVVDSDEKAGAYMEARLWEFIDMAAAWSKASPDPRTWDHVMVYAPKPAQRKPLTDEEIWKFWWSRPEVPEGEDDSMEAEFVAAVRAVLAAHGITGEKK